MNLQTSLSNADKTERLRTATSTAWTRAAFKSALTSAHVSSRVKSAAPRTGQARSSRKGRRPQHRAQKTRGKRDTACWSCALPGGDCWWLLLGLCLVLFWASFPPCFWSELCFPCLFLCVGRRLKDRSLPAFDGGRRVLSSVRDVESQSQGHRLKKRSVLPGFHTGLPRSRLFCDVARHNGCVVVWFLVVIRRSCGLKLFEHIRSLSPHGVVSRSSMVADVMLDVFCNTFIVLFLARSSSRCRGRHPGRGLLDHLH